MNSDALVRDLKRMVDGPILREESLASHTTFRVGGPAQIMLRPRDGDEAERVMGWAAERDIRLLCLGKGSNLLVDDRGVRGLVLATSPALDEIRCDGEPGATVSIRVGAGTPMAKLGGFCVREGLSGLEPLAGIPGSVGGAVAMNAGVNNYSVGNLVRSVRAFDPARRLTREIAVKDCGFTYRRSIFLRAGGPFILSARMEFGRGDRCKISEAMRERLEYRRRRHPWRERSAGSIFRNPAGTHAGKLIEAAGLKGRRIGGAMVSRVHANFIVNVGGATSSDIRRLIEEIRDAVLTRFGTELELELRIWSPEDEAG
ncbi:MAG: UDP-N-acetylmuramate dehydrogenase [Bacillota bacterium]